MVVNNCSDCPATNTTNSQASFSFIMLKNICQHDYAIGLESR